MTQCQAKLYYTLHIFYYIKVKIQFGKHGGQPKYM